MDTNTVNCAGLTVMLVFFFCARSYPRETAITVIMILAFVFSTPFLIG